MHYFRVNGTEQISDFKTFTKMSNKDNRRKTDKYNTELSKHTRYMDTCLFFVNTKPTRQTTEYSSWINKKKKKSKTKGNSHNTIFKNKAVKNKTLECDFYKLQPRVLLHTIFHL